MSDETEIPLTGGNVNASVVRIGDTVRRAPSKHSANVHRLLMHLEQKDYPFSPRLLGMDDQGREILTYLPGETDFPATLWTDTDVIIRAADMLRQFHDASAELIGIDGSWAFSHSVREVICHNDFAPYNMVFTDGLPTGVIDFDLAGPGPRLRDLAYLGYWLAPLSFTDGDMAMASLAELDAGNLRLKLLCSTYGTDDFDGLLAMIAEVLAHMSSHEAVRKMIGDVAAQHLADGGHFDHWGREAEQFANYRNQVFKNLIS